MLDTNKIHEIIFEALEAVNAEREEGEKIIQADQDGQFMTTIPLIGGANQIKVKTFDEMGNEAEETLEIIFSTAKI